VLGKVARCAPPVRELVSAVSVLGLSCPLHLAAGVAGVERPLQALEEAAREGVLLERSSPRDRDDEPAGVGRQAGGAGGAARPGRGPGGGVAGAAAARCQEPAVIGLSMLQGTTPEASNV
jgi:hypothetical protein